MANRKGPKTLKSRRDEPDPTGYSRVLTDLVDLLEESRRAAARSVNAVITATYWLVGRRIVEEEQGGEPRAEYGTALMARLSQDLSKHFGKGFSQRNLEQMRRFYIGWPIPQTASAESGHQLIAQTMSAISAPKDLAAVAVHFPLSWSQYVLLLSVTSHEGREFYETEALRGGWNVRQLRRQITSQFYERTVLSRDKAAMLHKGQKARPEDDVTPEEQLKDPYLLEFLGLKDEYSESELQAALIEKLESFLLELGGDFTFVGRQRRLRIGDAWYRVDLLFFHRRLRALVIIDLKLGQFTHADAGQMHLYLNYAREHWTLEGENPPVGLILCAHKDEAVAHYALEGLSNKVLAAEYRTALPDEKRLAEEIQRTRRMFIERSANEGPKG